MFNSEYIIFFNEWMNSHIFLRVKYFQRFQVENHIYIKEFYIFNKRSEYFNVIIFAMFSQHHEIYDT